MTQKSKRDRKDKTKQTASLATMIRRFKDGFDGFNHLGGNPSKRGDDRIWRKTVTRPAELLDTQRPAAKNFEDVLVAIDFVLQSEEFDNRDDGLFPRIEWQSLQAARDFLASIAPGVSGLKGVPS